MAWRWAGLAGTYGSRGSGLQAVVRGMASRAEAEARLRQICPDAERYETWEYNTDWRGGAATPGHCVWSGSGRPVESGSARGRKVPPVIGGGLPRKKIPPKLGR